MSRDVPEQLQLEFGHIDPISELYPRRHDFRQNKTFGEFIDDWATTSINFARKTHARRAVGVLSLIALTASVIPSEDHELSQKSMQEAGNLVDCSDGVNPDLADLQYEEGFNYGGLYDRIALFDLESWGNLRTRQIFANSIGAKQAADLLDSYLLDSPVKIDYDAIDWNSEEDYSDPNVNPKDKINRAGIENLGIAMYGIPKTLYEYAGIKEIRIVEELKYLKSQEQLAQERNNATEPDQVDEYYYLSGQYLKNDGIILLPKKSLVDGLELVKTIFHEVIGHGVMMVNCEPGTDSDWQKLNQSTGIEFSYAPEWKQTSEVTQLFNSGILVNGSYAGKNPREDVAETSMLLAPPFPLEIQYSGEVWSQNGTILDEKAKLIFDRVSEIEPDFGRFLALQYKMASLTATRSFDELLDTIGRKGLLQ